MTLSKIFQWYGPDFGPTKAARLAFLLPYLPEPRRSQLRALLDADPQAARIGVVHRPYDWGLNGSDS